MTSGFRLQALGFRGYRRMAQGSAASGVAHGSGLMLNLPPAFGA